ncbi:glycoside hydrolase family 99-like domain-containing protein [Pelosinus sp. IPA-1]|uniref:glycoside hydrolase family 99-like domain-containing protein n=1 Tax=Pelosinus sp. IPA-1 TaxID=3029569 RepID=UPI0024361805|nr:glycoside hydrolase family 99-like domain-containing protein [Pelosinus sp. IPA-1]GMA99558.1 hypothetical protein PIPA1_23580 [Pelosinus sp. IPA-1]
MKNLRYGFIGLLLTCLLALVVTTGAEAYQIGVYYFPGWKDNQLVAPNKQPWEMIKKYPDRKPLLGWYDEGADNVMQQEIDWMQQFGITFVAFDWYFTSDHQVRLNHALEAYLRAPNRTKLKFSLLWANHTHYPKSLSDWDAMVEYWLQNYLMQPEYLQINGQPVVFVFSANALASDAGKFGKTAQELIGRAQESARHVGLQGIYFVACTGAAGPMLTSAKEAGYSAFSAYNYHQGPRDVAQSHTYVELDDAYQRHWDTFAQKGNLPLIVPLTSGWDRRPWGGSKDPLHDNCLSTPTEFRKHLLAAKWFMDAHPMPDKQKIGIICAWNEYGEGSFIAPTEHNRFAYLEQIRSVFGRYRFVGNDNRRTVITGDGEKL